MSKPIILCVDDEKTVLNSLRQELEFALSGEEGLEVIEELIENGRVLKVVISDQTMPGMKGEVFLTEVHKRLPKVGKILLTGDSSKEGVNGGVYTGSNFPCLVKPWDNVRLRELVVSIATH
jgi:DNA-binding NtrC family response regulator